MTAPKLITATEVEALKVKTLSGRRALQLNRDGVLPAGVAVRIGKRVLFDPDRLIAWLAGGGSGLRGAGPPQPPADEEPIAAAGGA